MSRMTAIDLVAAVEICGHQEQLPKGSMDRILSVVSQPGIEKVDARVRFTANDWDIEKYHLKGATFRVHCKRSDGTDHLFILTNGIGEELNMAVSTYLGMDGHGSRHDGDPFHITGGNFQNRKRK